MAALTRTQAALLRALFRGPGDSAALARRVAGASRRLPRAKAAEVSRALAELRSEGLLRRWPVREPVRGSDRIYYELTAAGMEWVYSAQAAAKPGHKPPAKASPRDAGIDARLRRSLEISAVAGALRVRRRRGPSK